MLAHAADAAEAVGAYGRRRVVEIGAVEYIEKLAAQLNIKAIALGYPEDRTILPNPWPLMEGDIKNDYGSSRRPNSHA